MRRFTLEKVKNLYETDTFQILDVEVRETGNKKKKETFVKYRCLIDAHEDWVRLGNLSAGSGCKKCANMANGDRTRLTLIEIKLRLNEINSNIEILSSKYISIHKKLKCKCLIDNHIWYPTWGDLSQGSGCPVCAGNILHDGNRLSFIRPDLIKYFINPEEANDYTIRSHTKVQLVCPECGMLKSKNVTINTLYSRGFSCDYCSDGISIPEKFGISLFKKLNVKFETQKVFEWANNKKYDMFFTVSNIEYICEIHGLQHYRNIRQYKRTLIEEQENDKLKYNLAIQNGIKPENYIVIDCRKSEFDWLKKNYTKQLEKLFDLSNIDWMIIWEECQSSLVFKAWDAWNNKDEDDTTLTIAKRLSMSRVTITRYLKYGNELEKCIYDSKKEMSKNGKSRAKIIYQYALDGYFIRQFDSTSEAEKMLGVSLSHIAECHKGNRKSAYNFKWSYNPPNENGMYPD